MKNLLKLIVCSLMALALTSTVLSVATIASPVQKVYADNNTTNNSNNSSNNGNNSLDYLKGDGDGTFDELTKNTQPVLASIYKLVQTIGFGLLGVAAVIAAICFGLFKDSQKVKDNKDWFIRIFIAALLAGIALTILGWVININLG